MSLGFPLQDNIVIWLYNALQQRYMVLTEVAEPMIETAWQGVDELTFTIRADDPRSAYLLPDQLIEYPEGKFWINANYADNTEGPLRTIKAKARWHQLTWITKNGVRSLLGKTPLEGLTQILQGSGWTVGSVPADAELYTYEDIDPTVLEFARAWAQVTGYDLQFDTAAKTVSMVEQDGEERDVGFFYGSNMESVTRNFTPPQVTRLYPYGANNLDIAAVNPTGLNYIENYDWYIDNFGLTVTQARNLYRKDWTWKDDRFFTAVPLYDAAVGYLNQLSLPQISYSGKVIDFTRLTNITVDDCQAGDLVRVTDEILGYTALTKVTRTIRHPMSPDQDEVELELFTNNGLDVLNEERTIDYDQIQLIVNTNDSPVAVTGSLTAVNQVSVTTSGSAIVVASGHIVAQAAGAGTVQFQFQIDGANYGEPVLKDFTDLEQIEHSWVTFADGLDEGAHTLSWLMNVTNVVSGAGELLVDSNDARAVVWLSGGLGVGVDLSPNQYLIEVLPAFTELDGIIAAKPNDVTLVEFIHNADDIVDQNWLVGDSLPEFDALDLDVGYTEEVEPFLVEQVFVFGVWWVTNSPETQTDGTGATISRDVPPECQEDDLITVFLYHRSGADNITPPTIGAVTFTRVAQTVADDGTFEQWTEVWTATDDGTMAGETLTFTGTLSERMGMMVAILRNAEGGTVAVDTVATYGDQNATFTDPHPELVPNIDETDPFRLGVMFISCAYAETTPTETEYTLAYSTPVNTVPPVASTTDPGEYTAVLSTTDGTWVGDDGNRAYRWYLVSDDSTLPGTADESSYTPNISDYGTLAGQDVAVEVTTTNSHGTTTASSNSLTIPGTIDIFGDDLVDGGAPGETATSFLDGGSAGDVPKSAVDGQDEAALPTDSPVMDMGWYSLYWAEGDEFTALGLADGATLTAWPDEIGSNDLTQISSTPNKVAASALFNNMPAVNYAAGERHEATSSHTACRGFVAVMYLPGAAGSTNRFIDNDGDSGRYIPGMLYTGTYQFFAGGSAFQSATYGVGVPHLFVAYVNGGSSYLEIDGAPIYTGVNVGGDLISQLQLGSSGHAGATLPLVGLFTDNPKSDPKWAEFEQWVEDHYGITIA